MVDLTKPRARLEGELIAATQQLIFYQRLVLALQAKIELLDELVADSSANGTEEGAA